MIVFDFDGVIADSLDLCISICSQVAFEIGAPTSFGKNPFADLDPLTFHALADRFSLPNDEFSNEVNRRLSKSACHIPIFEGMPELLRSLSSEVPLAILSASHAATIETILHRNELQGSFVTCIGGNVVGTKAQKLAALCECAPSGVLAMVGDSASDMHAAQSAGVRSIGVAWGWQSTTRLRNAGAQIVAKAPRHLETVLESLLIPA